MIRGYDVSYDAQFRALHVRTVLKIEKLSRAYTRLRHCLQTYRFLAEFPCLSSRIQVPGPSPLLVVRAAEAANSGPGTRLEFAAS